MGKCRDTQTMQRIVDICSAVEQRREFERYWEARQLFDDIRQKSRKVAGETEEWQYLFEEKCAKSLFNMTHQPGGFDADSAFYIVPFALVFGRKLGIPDEKILEIVT
jgi:hypothetical protein